MKFIAFWKISPENVAKVRAKGEEYTKERKKNPEKYSKYMRLQDGTGIGFSMIGKYKGFTLLEADNEEQMYNTVEFWSPLMTFTYVPIRQTPGAKRA